MVENHADELSLLAYVDDELGAGERRALAEHLEACVECGALARRLAAGREVLKNAPLLELPEERLRAIVASLPKQEARSSFFAPLLRRGPALAAAAALVLVAGLIAVATQIDGGGGDDQGAADGGGDAAAVQENAGQDTAGAAGGETDAQKSFDAPGKLVVRVQGPPSEIVLVLRRNGVTASVQDGSVVADGDRAEIRRILADRPPGRVAVYVR